MFRSMDKAFNVKKICGRKKAVLKRLSIRRRIKHLRRKYPESYCTSSRARKIGVRRIRLVAPQYFNLVNMAHRSKVIRFVTDLRSAILDRKRVHIDFSETKRMFTCGTLLFISEVDRALRVTNASSYIECVYPRDRIVSQVLQQIGFYRLIGKRDRLNTDSFDESVKYWQIATGTQALGQEFDPILSKYEGQITKALQSSLYKGVTEAMTNCSQHAYVEERGDGVSLEREEKRWWMFSQEKDGRLDVAICDLGIGIPRSLPRKKIPGWIEAINLFLDKFSLGGKSPDCAMIKAAIEIGATRTDLPYRGKGLRQIADVVVQSGGGRLTIHSNSGGYFYSPKINTV